MIYITAHNKDLALNSDEVTIFEFDKRKRKISVQFKDNTLPLLIINKADRCFVLDGNSSAEVKSSESNFVTKLKDKISDLTDKLEKERKVQSEGYKIYLNYHHHFGDASPSEVQHLLHTYQETFRTLREKLVTDGYSIPELREYLTDQEKYHQHLERKIP